MAKYHLKKLIIGTRGSDLARWQASWVKDTLIQRNPHLEIQLQIIRTQGDKIRDTALSQIGAEGIFTREIEESLLTGAIHLAVHSLKDLPTQQPAGLVIAAVPARQESADALVSKNNFTLNSLPAGALVLTGSLRRRAQLLHIRPDLRVENIRGNVPTRLRKLDESDAAAMVVSAAGLQRLGLQDRITQRLEPTEFIPACGQGALALEIRADDRQTRELIQPLDDIATRRAVTAERAVLAHLEGGCQIPVGAYAQVKDNILTIKGLLADLAGKRVLLAEAAGPADQPTELGSYVAQQLLNQGGDEIIAEIRRMTDRL